MVLWAFALGFDTAGMVLMNALIGAGDTRRAMWISVIAQWVFFLPVAWFVGPALGFGLLGVWLANSVYRVGQAAVCAQQWAGRRWARIDL
jgi:Na+-driven multidrug efflux pump